MPPDGKPDLAKVLQHYGVDINDYRQQSLVCCPVHSEDRPSCSVSLTKQLWQCLACGARGDSYSLIQAKEGLKTFAEVVQFAAEHFGATPPPQRSGRRGLDGASRSGGGGYRPTFRRKRLND